MRATAIEMEGIQAAAKAIQEQYCERQEILLQDVADSLEEQVAEMRRMIRVHNVTMTESGHPELAISGPEFQSAVDSVANQRREFIVALATSQVLEDFGEPEAADAAIKPHFLAALV